MTRSYHHRTSINAPAAFAFAWHERPGAFERLAPPWETIEVEERPENLDDGGELRFRIKIGPVWQRWRARHYGCIPGKRFCDRQVEGPFAFWEHEHLFEVASEETCTIEDNVTFRLPLEPFSKMAPRALVENKVSSTFAYRAATAKHDIECHYKAGLDPMIVLITGSSGLVGSQLIPFLKGGGHDIVRLVRSHKRSEEPMVAWNPRQGFNGKQLEQIEGVDAVVNLAGENIFSFWTQEKKRRIRESRVNTTRHLCEGLAQLKKKPKVLISGSAVGIYGDREDEELKEDSLQGCGFLAEVGRAWEEATLPAEEAGIRVVHLRIGVVLTPTGGALGTMLPPFKAGLGGKLGSGRQWMSWITINDLLALILHCIANDTLSGPVNAVAPHPSRNVELTRTLGSVLRRPTFFRLPKVVLSTALRDMADEMFLASTRALPTKALESGFTFQHPRLEPALRYLLGRKK